MGKHNKNKNINDNGFNYLLFGGDTTGCILCWNLSSINMQTPVCVISGHSDIIYDLSIINNKWLFSVSHDEQLMYLNINGFEKKLSDQSIDYVFSTKLFKDDSKYPLKAIEYNYIENELIFGSRKCNIFKLNNDDEKNTNDNKKNNKDKYFKSNNHLNTKDLDHICNLKIRDNLMM